MNDQSRKARLLRAALDLHGPVEPTNDDWREWVELARTERVLPLLHHIGTDPESSLDDDVRQASTAIQREIMASAVRFEHSLLKIASAFGEVGIVFAVLKGMATAHLDLPDSSLRQYGDIDLLVAPADRVRATQALELLGWKQAYPLPRHHEQFTHAVTLRNDRRVEVDLHQRIAHRALGELVPTQELLDAAVEFEIAGHPLRALSASDRLIHAAIHTQASSGQYRRLSSMADVLVMAERLAPEASEVLDRAESWRVRPVVERAIEVAFTTADLHLPEAWQVAIRRPIRSRDRLVEKAYLSDRRRPLIEELAYLRVLDDWQKRVRYNRGYLATDADYAKRHHRNGPAAQLKYLWSKMRSSRPT